MKPEEIPAFLATVDGAFEELMDASSDRAEDFADFIIAHLNDRPKGEPCHYNNADMMMGMAMALDSIMHDAPDKRVAIAVLSRLLMCMAQDNSPREKRVVQ